jgi:hypothetical protein
MRCSRRALLLVAALAAACSADRGLPPPVPTAVQPALAYAGLEVPVTIHGHAFYVRAWVGADGSPGDGVSTEFRAWLGSEPLGEVTWVDETTLTAVVPATIGVSAHDLVVEGPYGTSGELASAYVVLAGPGPTLHVVASALPPAALVGEPAFIRVRVENLGGVLLRSVVAHLKPAAAPRVDLPGAPPPKDLVPGGFFDADFPVTTAVAGTFAFEAKANGIDPLGAFVTSPKVPAVLEVVLP